jgi:hypothetical protein
MTNELKRAMARYEEARVRYRKAVLASLDGASNGDVILAAIRDFQRASAELKQLSPPAKAPPASSPPPEPAVATQTAEVLGTVWANLRRAVSGFGARIRMASSG